MLTSRADVKARLFASLVILLCGWIMASAPAAAQYIWPIPVSPAVQMALDRVQQRYLARSGLTVRQLESQSPRTMATIIGLVIREQSFHAQRNPALQGQLEQLVYESLAYLSRVGANVGYRERWKQEQGSWADMQSFFHAAVAGQLDEWAQGELGVRPELGPDILQTVRVDPNRPPLGQQPAAPEVAATPPVAQPPADPAGRPLVPMQDPRSITLLGQSADPREQAPPAAPDAARPGGITDAQRLADAADWTYRGTIAMQQKRYQEALENYSNALKLAPENEYYWRNRASLYLTAGRYDLAFADYSKAIEVRPDRSAAWCSRAGIHFVLGRKNQPNWDPGRRQQALADYDQCCRVSRAENVIFQGRPVLSGCTQAADIRAGRM